MVPESGSLLHEVPEGLQKRMNLASREVLDRILQREAYTRERISLFEAGQIRELEAYIEHLLQVEECKNTRASLRSSSSNERPTSVRSIVKRRPLSMEKSVSFSTSSPEVKEFDVDSDTPLSPYNDWTNEEALSSDDDADFNRNEAVVVYRRQRAEDELNKQDEQDVENPQSITPNDTHDNDSKQPTQDPLFGDLHIPDQILHTNHPPEDEEKLPSFEDVMSSAFVETPSSGSKPSSPVDQSPEATPQLSPHAAPFVGSAPINIAYQPSHSMSGARTNLKLSDGTLKADIDNASPSSQDDKLGEIDPGRMSFSQRLAFEQRILDLQGARAGR